MNIVFSNKSFYVFFVGAGISRDSPSNFPIANQIINKIINHLSPNKKIEEVLLQLSDPNRSNKRHPNDYLRFEQIIDLLQQYVDPSLSILHFIDFYSEPNDNHYLLAKRAIKGNIIITTNFDCLIEKAILNYGFLPITICTDDDFRLFRKNCSNKFIPIFKIHGSYRKYHGKHYTYSVPSIKATLSSLLMGSNGLSLPEPKKKFLKNILLNQKLIIAGYSGQDDLDIIPSMYETNPKLIYWLIHKQNNKYKYRIINILKQSCSKNETAQSSRERLLNYYATQKRNKVVVVETHTHAFLKNNFSYDKVQSPNAKIITEEIFNTFLDKWSKLVSKEHKQFLLIGEIMRVLSRYNDASNYLFKAWKALNNDNSDSALVAFTISRVLMYLGKKKPAVFWSRKSISLLKRNTFPSVKANCWHTMGVTLYSDGKLDEAIIWYKKSLVYCRKYKLFTILSYTYHDYAIIYHDRGLYTKAAKYYNKSIALSEHQGDIKHVAFSRHQLGTLYYEIGNFTESKKNLLETNKISNLIGDYDGYGNSLYELSLIEFLSGNINECINSIEEVIKINKLTNRNEYSPIFLQQIGVAYLELNLKKAFIYLEKAKKEYLDIGDKINIAELTCYYSYYYLLIGNLKQALIEAKLALKLAQNTEVKNYLLRSEFMLCLSTLINNTSSKTKHNIPDLINETFRIGAKDLILDQIYYLSRFKLLHFYQNEIRDAVLYTQNIYQELSNSYRANIIDDSLNKLRHQQGTLL